METIGHDTGVGKETLDHPPIGTGQVNTDHLDLLPAP